MLYAYPQLDEREQFVVQRIHELRENLRYFVAQNPKRWTGLLARMTRARALRASNSIENINVSQEDAIAAVDGEDPADADRATWRAVVGYQEAMTYVLARCRDQSFHFTKDAILAIHFMISQSDMDANPGNLRRGWVGVRNTQENKIVHEGVDRDLLEPLIDELIDYLNNGDATNVLIKASLAHLNLTLMHPFSDGNGRTARCLQTAVLANEGIVAQEFSSIEEYIGRNQLEYYDVLAECGGGGWNPQRGCKPWIRFCLKGHYFQLQTLLRRNEELGRAYGELARLVARLGMPERTALGLLEAAFGHKVRNASYRAGTGVSNNLASRDLKLLVDAGLLVPEGERRGRHYLASHEVRAIREQVQMHRHIEDPFTETPNTDQLELKI